MTTRDVAATFVGSWSRYARRCATTVPGHGLWLSRSTSSCASPRRLLEEFLFLGVLTLFALENWCIIRLRPCIWQPFLGVWVLHVEYRSLDSSRDDFVYGRNAWLDSGYGDCDSTWLLDEFHTISTLPWTRILKCLGVVLVIVQLICLFKVRLRLDFVGILRNWLGIDLVCLF